MRSWVRTRRVCGEMFVRRGTPKLYIGRDPSSTRIREWGTLVEVFVGGNRQELLEVVPKRDPVEDLARLVVAALREDVGADGRLDLFELLALDVTHELGGHAGSFGERYAVVDPLPHLRP